MSKELEVLKDIREHCGKEIVKCVWEDNAGYSKTITINDLCDIIETALKDYEEYKQVLSDYGFTLVNFREACFTLAQFRGSGFTGIEKSFKALEIIIEKNVDIHLLKNASDLNDYNSVIPYEYELTQEEYDLLKKVLL